MRWARIACSVRAERYAPKPMEAPPASISPSAISTTLPAVTPLIARTKTSVVTRPSVRPKTVSRSQPPRWRCCSSRSFIYHHATPSLLLEMADDEQHDQGKGGGKDRDPNQAGRYEEPKGRGNPQGCRGRQAVDVVFGPEDRAGAQEADPRYHLRRDAGGVTRRT